MSSTDSQLKLRYGATDIIFVSLDKRQEKIFDTVWAHYLRSNEKEKNNRSKQPHRRGEKQKRKGESKKTGTKRRKKTKRKQNLQQRQEPWQDQKNEFSGPQKQTKQFRNRNRRKTRSQNDNSTIEYLARRHYRRHER